MEKTPATTYMFPCVRAEYRIHTDVLSIEFGFGYAVASCGWTVCFQRTFEGAEGRT